MTEIERLQANLLAHANMKNEAISSAKLHAPVLHELTARAVHVMAEQPLSDACREAGWIKAVGLLAQLAQQALIASRDCESVAVSMREFRRADAALTAAMTGADGEAGE